MAKALDFTETLGEPGDTTKINIHIDNISDANAADILAAIEALGIPLSWMLSEVVGQAPELTWSNTSQDAATATLARDHVRPAIKTAMQKWRNRKAGFRNGIEPRRRHTRDCLCHQWIVRNGQGVDRQDGRKRLSIGSTPWQR